MPILFLSLLLSILALPAIAQQTDSSSAETIRLAEQNLRQVLAGPHERAFRQILTAVRILPDTLDTAAVYDLVVHFDPQRYQNPQVGTYPLTFEDQFIIWESASPVYPRHSLDQQPILPARHLHRA